MTSPETAVETAVDTPLMISVVVICYRQEKFIADALDSILAQTAYDRIDRVIVVDDKSPDGSFDIIQDYAAKHPKIQAVRHEVNSRGASVPRNTGIALATAPYIAFLDGDDIWMPTKIEEQVAVLEEHPEIGLLFSDFITFDDKTGAERPSTTVRYSLGEPNQLRKFFVQGGPVIPSCAVVSRAVIDEVGPFETNLRFNEDSEMWNRVASAAPLHHLPRPLFRKREWFGSKGSGVNDAGQIASKHEITRRMIERVPELAEVADKRSSGIELQAAVRNFRRGATAEARAHLKKALEHDPKNRKARLYLAVSHLPGSTDRWLNILRGLQHGVLRRAQ